MPDKPYYMVCLDLEGRSCLVVGAGPIGLEKASGLAECGARVTVVAPHAVAGLAALDVEWLAREYQPGDLEGRFLVVAATSNEELNRRVFADAEARGLLCNVADVPELCSFILPAVHREGPIAVAVSTGGASPALAQVLRDRIAGLVGPEEARVAERLRALRPWAKRTFPTYEARRDFFRREVERSLR
jgi:precorrin-2 dehydrogenase / sirohydrochlorin ferrochelatase